MTLLAQLGGAYSVGQMAIWIVVILAVCALVMVFVRQSGVAVPAWVTQVLSILVVAFVVIVAIKFLLSM